MRKLTEVLILTVILSALFSAACAASENITKINDLIENSSALDNTQVTVLGEVIGEALERGEYAWININDTTNAIGIWVKQCDIEQIKYYGDYKHKGDIVKITGVFSRACTEHGGDVDIHCADIEIIETGHAVSAEISYIKLTVTAILIAIASLTIAMYFKISKKLKYKAY